MRAPFTVLAALSGLLVLGAGPAGAFSLSNDVGGDGYVQIIPGGFDLFGSDNGVGGNTTAYLGIAAAPLTLTYDWVYTTNDSSGSFWDPAGYVIDGIRFQLSTDVNIPGSGPHSGDGSGTVTFSVAAGQKFGFYVYTRDGIEGRADIAVTAAENALNISTPAPAALPLFASGLGLLGLLARRRKQRSAAA